MTGPDDEFDDFLARRKPVFRRSTEDPFEPPEELDRHRAAQRARGHRARAARAGLPRPALGNARGARGDLAAGLHGGAAARRTRQRARARSHGAEHQPADRESGRGSRAHGRGLGCQRCEHPHGRAGRADVQDARRLWAASGGFVSEEEGNRYAPAPPPPPVASAPRTEPPAPGAVQDPAEPQRSVVMSAPPPSEAERAVAAGRLHPGVAPRYNDLARRDRPAARRRQGSRGGCGTGRVQAPAPRLRGIS